MFWAFGSFLDQFTDGNICRWLKKAFSSLPRTGWGSYCAAPSSARLGGVGDIFSESYWP